MESPWGGRAGPAHPQAVPVGKACVRIAQKPGKFSSGPGRESSWYTLGIPVGLSPKVLPVKQPLVGT